MKKGEMLPDGIWQGDCLELLPKLTDGIADLALVGFRFDAIVGGWLKH